MYRRTFHAKQDLKNLSTSYSFCPFLRDLCVRWSFGRCLQKVRRFLKVVPSMPLADCRLGNLGMGYALVFPSHLAKCIRIPPLAGLVPFSSLGHGKRPII